ncbi:MAG TPA: TRAP transporter small permease subunit [Burkholderiaceae bacterium]|nr:TRAP transporter small permease subunit [Burkholderiaceae bacterium]
MILRLIDQVNEIIGRIVSWVAVIFAVLIIFDVVMRYFFNLPTRWAFDVTKQLYGFYFVMLGAYTLRHQGHVRVDLLIVQLSPAVRRWVEIAGYPIFFFPFLWVFTTKSYEFAIRSWNQGEVTYGAVQLPVYPLKMAMFVAAALLLLQGIAEFIKLIMNKDVAANGS